MGLEQCRSDPHHEFGGLNCLRQAQSLQQTAKQAGVSQEEARQILARCREKLHERRLQRPRPHLDDKVRTAYLFSLNTLCNPAQEYNGSAMLAM